MSGPFGEDYSIQKEVEDIDAFLTRTGANYVFGVSVGAIICLEAASVLPAVHKAAIYEPPLFADRSRPSAFQDRFDKEMAEGKIRKRW